MSINNVCISGNLVADCDKKKAGEMPLVTFVMAVNDRRKVGGEWQDYANFIECSLFGNLGKALSDKLVKGARVCVYGKLYQSRWEKDGINMSKVSVTVNDIEIMRKPEKTDSKATQEEIPW